MFIPNPSSPTDSCSSSQSSPSEKMNHNWFVLLDGERPIGEERNCFVLLEAVVRVFLLERSAACGGPWVGDEHGSDQAVMCAKRKSFTRLGDLVSAYRRAVSLTPRRENTTRNAENLLIWTSLEIELFPSLDICGCMMQNLRGLGKEKVTPEGCPQSLAKVAPSVIEI
nr:hypothetical protein Iba_chr09fCG7680 [Ipomoea batatas]